MNIHSMDPLTKLLGIVLRSGLSEARFSRWVMGRHESAINRWKKGGKIPAETCSWIQRLKSVTVHGDEIVIVIRRGAAGRMETRHHGRGAHRRERVSAAVVES